MKAEWEMYKINERIRGVFFDAEVDEETGEVLIDLDELKELYKQGDDIAEEVALVYKEADYNDIMLTEEIRRLTKRRASVRNMKDKAHDLVEEWLNGKDMETSRVKIKHRKTERVEVTDESQIPAEYIRVKTEPDKAGLKKALKAGAEIDGAELVSDVSMSIK